MFTWLLVAVALSDPPHAQYSAPTQQISSKLRGLNAAEASALIAKLKDAQRELRAGKREMFELLAGSPASYPAAQVAPRRAFLDMSFETPWSIEREPAAGLWQPYELRYFPPGRQSLMWKVNVVVGQTGELVRVEMVYTAPPPF